MVASRRNVFFSKLKRREFACKEDARKEAELWLSEHPFCRFKDRSVKLVTKRNGKMRGRPRMGEKLLEFHQIEAEIEFNVEKVAEAKSKLGRFILATNDLNLDPNTILSHYKGQQAVERGF